MIGGCRAPRLGGGKISGVYLALASRYESFKEYNENDGGWTPLRCAALRGNVHIVRQLIALKVDVNAPLTRRIRGNWVSANALKGLNIICHTAHWCDTPAHVEVLNVLYFEGGAKMRQNNIDVLNAASHRRTLKGQKNYGAEWVLDKFPQWNVNTRSLHGAFPLYQILLYSSNLPLARRLIECFGADLTMNFSPAKFDLLWAACMSHTFDVKVVEYIYDKMRHVLPTSWTLCERGNMSAVRYYTIRPFWRLSPVAGWPRLVIQRFLLDSYHSTLLHHTVYEASIPASLWLLENGADPTIENHSGETPLTIAEKRGHVDIFKLLKQFMGDCRNAVASTAI